MLRHNILFACSPSHQRALCRDTHLFTRPRLLQPVIDGSQTAPPPHLQNSLRLPRQVQSLAPIVCVLDFPHQGAGHTEPSPLAAALARSLGAICLNVAQCIQLLEGGSALAAEIGACIHPAQPMASQPTPPSQADIQNSNVGDALCARAVASVAGRLEARSLGLVLDGWPRSFGQSALLEAAGVDVSALCWADPSSTISSHHQSSELTEAQIVLMQEHRDRSLDVQVSAL